MSTNKYTLTFVGADRVCNLIHNAQNEQYGSYNFHIQVSILSVNVQEKEEIFKLHVFINEEECDVWDM
jgi:hypothetical protein